MTTLYAGNPASCPADIAVPTGSDARNTASYTPALQQLADRTAFIGASTPIGGVGLVTGPTGLNGTGAGGIRTADPGATGVIGTGGAGNQDGLLGFGSGSGSGSAK